MNQLDDLLPIGLEDALPERSAIITRAMREILRAMDAGDYAIDDDGEPAGGLATPDRETPSSRFAWLALMLLGIPLPWRRRKPDPD